jgi:hypothetical protein
MQPYSDPQRAYDQATMDSVVDKLREGNFILEAVLGPAGFRFESLAAGTGSGGNFASGRDPRQPWNRNSFSP